MEMSSLASWIGLEREGIKGLFLFIFSLTKETFRFHSATAIALLNYSNSIYNTLADFFHQTVAVHGFSLDRI
jgi:hypothetical protein